MTANRNRVFAYATGLTVVVAVLGGLLARMTVLVPIDASASTVEARLGSMVVVGLLLAVVALYVTIPLFIGVLRAREDDRWEHHLGIAGLSIFGPPLAFAATAYVFTFGLPIGVSGLLFLALFFATFVAALLSVLLVIGLLSQRVPDDQPMWPVVFNLSLVVVFVIGFVFVQPFATDFADDHTESYGGFGGPNAVFTVDERTTADGETVLTITHDGGDPLLAEDVSVRGEGFADVEGADQTEPGPWRGTVSGERPRRGGAAIVTGDSVEVGVTDDCEITVVYTGDEGISAKFYHRCDEQ